MMILVGEELRVRCGVASDMDVRCGGVRTARATAWCTRNC